jgi:hypothetical protein
MEEEKDKSPAREPLIERGWARPNILLFVIVLSRWALTLLVPAGVISRLMPTNLLTVPLAVLGFALLVWDAVYGTIRRARAIYSPSSHQPDIRDRLTAAQWARKAKTLITIDLIKSYAYFIYAFALHRPTYLAHTPVHSMLILILVQPCTSASQRLQPSVMAISILSRLLHVFSLHQKSSLASFSQCLCSQSSQVTFKGSISVWSVLEWSSEKLA